ncbi:MAG: helix-turn-helix domain-containing protein [Verrucomicrobia bacterium]|nr:helix-turn-helix domain-containing protein [Verrucomicrobiota bacterium]
MNVQKEVRPKEAAEMIGCSVGLVYSLMNQGQLQHRAIVRRGYERGIRLISVESINRFLAPNPLPPIEAPKPGRWKAKDEGASS